MSKAQFKHKCLSCSSEFLQATPWIDPQLYSDPQKATKTSTFWCPKCGAGQALKLRILEDNEVEVIENLTYETTFSSNEPPNYYVNDDSNKETPSEELALLLMGSKPQDEY